MMVKTIVGIFAHPDDEAFGPAGTLAKLAKENSVYLICATNGESGTLNLKASKKIGEIRKRELAASAKILGIKKVFFLGFKDGTLNNVQYHEVAGSMKKILNKLKPEVLISYAITGISGHLDHVAVSLITSHVFEQLPFAKELWQQCITDTQRKKFGDYFVYVPPGYKEEDIDKIIDIANVWELKKKAMYQHKSQISDVKRVERFTKTFPKKEYFLILKK